MPKRLLDELALDPRARVMLLATIVLATLVIRAATLGTYVLADTTEARYGEIARVMLTTGNWVTPQEAPGHPFWAKPPLYAWLSAASMALAGVNEFAARLPSFVFALGTLALVFVWARDAGDDSEWLARERGLIAAAILATSALFYASAGAVMTDPSLAFCSTWMMVAFMQSLLRGRTDRMWRWGFFVAAGLGMLAKGPVVMVYAGLPIALWTLATGRVRDAWRALPWLRGTLLFIAIWAPWYVAAELRTPGFLDYFLLGEHVMRFLDPGWRGDLYGAAHARPRGFIWLFLIGAFGVWAPIVIALLVSRVRASGVRVRLRTADPQFTYALLCAAVPLLFFTFARNIIWPYVLPMMSPLAVLLATAFERRLPAPAWARTFLVALPLAWASLAVGWIIWAPYGTRDRSTAPLVQAWRQESVAEPGPLAYWGDHVPHSLRFYSRGTATALTGATGVPPPRVPMFVIVERKQLPEVGQWLDSMQPNYDLEPLAGNARWVLAEIEAARKPR